MLKKIIFLAVLVGCVQTALSQATSGSAVNISAESYFLTPPTLSNYCLVAASGQTATACATNLTDVHWFKFTIPTSETTCSVKITVIPTGFDAVVDLYDNTGAYRQCANSAGANANEVLKSDPTIIPISTGLTYYFRVSSTTDVSSACFNLGLEFYAAGQLRPVNSPNPTTDTGLPGYALNQSVLRTIFTATEEAFIQATQWRFVDTDTPTAAGCTFTVNSNFQQLALSSLPCVCYNNSYIVYAQLKIDNHWTGECIVRNINMESAPSTAISGTNCAVYSLSSTLYATSGTYLGANQQLQWEFSQNGSIVASVYSPIGQNYIILSTVPCLRYNKIYSVRSRVNVCGVWGPWTSAYCMLTSPFPVLQLQSTQCGATIPRTSILRCNPISPVNQYIWQIAEINPGNVAVPIGPATVLCSPTEYVSAASAMQNGRTYRVGIKPVLTSSTTSCNNQFSTCSTYQQGEYGPFCQVTISGSGMILNNNVASDFFSPTLNHDQHRAMIINNNDENGRLLSLNLTQSSLIGNGVLKIYNISGQLVYEVNVIDIPENSYYQLFIPETLSPNIYVLSLETTQGVFNEKFLIAQ
jgi:hypothetical protein